PPQPGHLRRQREVHLSAGIFVVDRAPAAPVAGGSATGRGRRTMTKKADFKQRVRARMAKTGESYATARSHVLAEQTPASRAMLAALHVSNGDCTDLAGTGLASRVLYWRDSRREGPVREVGPEELRRIRAAFLVGAGVDDRAE